MKKLIPTILLIGLMLFTVSCKKNPSASQTPPSTSESAISTAPSESDIQLNEKELSLSVGKSHKLVPSLSSSNQENSSFQFISSDPSVAYIDQNGNVSAVKEGNAVITVKSQSGTSADCKVTVTPRNDPMDKLVKRYGTELEWTDYYEEGIRFNENKEILFSPYIWELSYDHTNPSNNVHQIYLRFTHLPSNNINEEFTFPSMLLELKRTEGYYHYDIVLQGMDTENEFCPIAGEHYKIEFAVVHKYKKTVSYYGLFEDVQAPKKLDSSEFYSPSPMPGFMPKEEGQVYLKYSTTEGGTIVGNAIQAHAPGTTGFEVTAKANDGYRFVMWNDGVKSISRTDTTAEKDSTHTAYFIKEASSDMPIANMYIFTDNGGMVRSKTYMNAQMFIVGSSKKEYDISVPLQIKGRGNSSWNALAPLDNYDSKNSYRIKLNEQEQLLGIGESKNKDWILNSNKFDLSGLRNYLVWDFADRMNTMPYVPDCEWVQLYINSEYRGMYMVTERIEVAKDRVEVDDKLESTDKGYLIEIDFRGTEEKQPYFYVDGYGCSSNNNPREFVVKSECTDADLEFIKNYVQQCHNAIVSGDRQAIDMLVDIPSFIDMYIIEELSKDVDVGAASCFMQKAPGGKIYFTAPWDFDFGFGTYGKAVDVEEMVSIGESGCTWYSALLEHEWFRKEVLNRMSELDDDFAATLKEVKNKANHLESSADKNAFFWNMYGNRFHGYVSNDASYNLQNYDEHIDFIVNWSTSRWNYMKDFLSTYTGFENYHPEELLPE